MGTPIQKEIWLHIGGVYPEETLAVEYNCILQNKQHFYHTGKAFESRHVLLGWLEGVSSLLFETGRLQPVNWFERWCEVGRSTEMVDFLRIIDLSRKALDSDPGADEALLRFSEETYSIVHAHLNGNFRKEGAYLAVPFQQMLTSKLYAKLYKVGVATNPLDCAVSGDNACRCSKLVDSKVIESGSHQQ